MEGPDDPQTTNGVSEVDDSQFIERKVATPKGDEFDILRLSGRKRGPVLQRAGTIKITMSIPKKKLSSFINGPEFDPPQILQSSLESLPDGEHTPGSPTKKRKLANS